MPTVVSLAAHKQSAAKFDQNLEQTVQHLEDATVQLRDDLVNLAMAGPWKVWNAEQPTGAKVVVEVEKLLEVGDDRVKSLAELLAHAMTVLVELRCGGDPEA